MHICVAFIIDYFLKHFFFKMISRFTLVPSKFHLFCSICLICFFRLTLVWLNIGFMLTDRYWIRWGFTFLLVSMMVTQCKPSQLSVSWSLETGTRTATSLRASVGFLANQSLARWLKTLAFAASSGRTTLSVSLLFMWASNDLPHSSSAISHWHINFINPCL